MSATTEPESILVLDFGAQYVQLIVRRVREQHVYSEIRPADTPVEQLVAEQPKGIILSGGPSSVYAKGAPRIDPKIFAAGIPILGICYGHQLMAHLLGGEVVPGGQREYGHTSVEIVEPDLLARRRGQPLPDLDEPRGPGAASPAGICQSGHQQECSGGRNGRYRPASVWSTVPPRGPAHPLRPPDTAQLPVPGLRLHGKLAPNRLHRGDSG